MRIIGCTRNSLIGDIVASLPFTNYLEKIYPKSYKCSYIDKKCSQIIPFLINHPLIDKIQISDKPDIVTNQDIELFKSFDIVFNPFPQLTRPDYYNCHHITQELFLMNQLLSNGARIIPTEWDILTEEEKQPKLCQWFNVERKPKSIAIWPFSGYTSYNNTSLSLNLRSPNKEWWGKLIQLLPDYQIIQLGFPDSELLDYPNIIDCRKLSLFDAIKVSLGCDCSITTDSGSGWILGAYGAPQIILYTNYLPNHYQNKDAMVAINYKNNSISLFGDGGINNILQSDVIHAIKILC